MTVIDKRDASGHRLHKDGQPILLIVEVNPKYQMHSDVLELVTQAWQKLGIDARIDPIDNNYFQARNANWEHVMQISDTNGGGLDPIWRATDYVPIEDDSRFGAGWAMWYLTNGKQGVEPTKDIAERLALYEQVRQTPPGPKQEELMKQVLQRAAHGFLADGVEKVRLSQSGAAMNEQRVVCPSQILGDGDGRGMGQTVVRSDDERLERNHDGQRRFRRERDASNVGWHRGFSEH